MTVLLGWLAVDAGFRHKTIRAARKASRAVGNELEARKMIGDVMDGMAEGDPQSMVLVGMHHVSTQKIYPEALGRALAREFGPPSRSTGLNLLKRAADQGSRQAEWMYWRTVGWPEGDELLALVQSGSEMAAHRLMGSLAGEGCQVDDHALSQLEEAAAALSGGGLDESDNKNWPIADAAGRVRHSLEEIRTWKAESCAKPVV